MKDYESLREHARSCVAHFRACFGCDVYRTTKPFLRFDEDGTVTGVAYCEDCAATIGDSVRLENVA